MLKSFAKIALQSQIRRENTSRHKKFMPWDKIEKVALLVNQENCTDKKALDKFIDDTNKYVEVYYFEPHSKEASYHDWQCFSKKDFNLLKLPKKKLESDFRNKNFDICINTCNEEDLFSESVHSKLSAPLKCGAHSEYNISDLIIKKTETANLINYLSEVVRYLKMIRV